MLSCKNCGCSILFGSQCEDCKGKPIPEKNSVKIQTSTDVKQPKNASLLNIHTAVIFIVCGLIYWRLISVGCSILWMIFLFPAVLIFSEGIYLLFLFVIPHEFMEAKSRGTSTFKFIIGAILFIIACILAEIFIHHPMRHIFPNW